MVTKTADVVVVGAGIIGTSAAAFVAQAGASVIVFDRESIGAAASGRNSGVIQHPFDEVLIGLHLESLALYRRLVEATASAATPFTMPTGPSGLLLVSTDAAGTESLASEAAATVPGLDPTFLTSAEVQGVEPTLGPGVVACRLNIGYPVEPGAATLAYAETARAAGARIVTGFEVELWTGDGRVLGVRRGEERVSSGSVIVAAGAWTPHVIDPGDEWRAIVPNWGVVAEIDLRDPPGHVLEEAEIDTAIEPPAPGETVVLGGVAFSLVTAAGRSALGSTFLDERPDPEAWVSALVERGSRFVPAIARAPVRGVRVCPRPVSRDGRPLVGALPWLRGAFVAAGHGPWGISTGPATGRMAADLALGRDASIPLELDPGRFGLPG